MRNKTKLKSILQVIIPLLISNGCHIQQPASAVKSIELNLSSLGQLDVKQQSKYLLRPFDSTYGGDYLLYNELQEYVIRGINQMGLIPTSNIDSAAYIFYFDFGVSAPEKYEFEITEGVYNKIGTAEFYGTTDIYLNYYPGYTFLKRQNLNHSTTATFRTETRRSHINLFTHYIILSCFDRNKMATDFNTSVIWKMKADAQVSNNDLRVVIPYLVAGSHSLFGKNTGKSISRQVYLNPEFYPSILGSPVSLRDPLTLISDDELKITNAKSALKGKGLPTRTSAEVNLGEVVYYMSRYGEQIFGIVVGKEDFNVLLRTYPTKNQALDVQVRVSELFRIQNR
jgi:hypothetical protein